MPALVLCILIATLSSLSLTLGLSGSKTAQEKMSLALTVAEAIGLCELLVLVRDLIFLSEYP